MTEIKEKEEKNGEIAEIPYDDMYESKYQQNQNSSLIIEILKNISPSQDLLRISFPAFILEKRSLLEKLSDFFINQSLILNITTMIDPEQRFLAMVRFFISCWYRIPKSGVAKPFNPILGEFFKCSWKYSSSETIYVSEQVSHHPPISAFYFRNKNKNILCYGHIAPHASLNILGNSAGTICEGPFLFRICNLDEDYIMSYPTINVKGLFYGTMSMENTGESFIECKKSGYTAKFEWLEDRQVLGNIYFKDEHVYTVSGDYTNTVTIKHNIKKKSFSFF